jgi:hypothetical protein
VGLLDHHFQNLNRRFDTMTDILTGLSEDAAAIAAALPPIADELATLHTQLGELQQKIAEGQTVDPGEVAGIKQSLDASIDTLKNLVPAPTPEPTPAPEPSPAPTPGPTSEPTPTPEPEAAPTPASTEAEPSADGEQ